MSIDCPIVIQPITVQSVRGFEGILSGTGFCDYQASCTERVLERNSRGRGQSAENPPAYLMKGGIFPVGHGELNCESVQTRQMAW